MITTQHVEEDLSKAYIQAVAARAGVNLAIKDRSHDYTVDGTFHQVSYRNHKRNESGFSIDFQLKACKNVIFDEDSIRYDLDVETHNYLVERSRKKHSTQLILLLLALHEDANQWMALTEEQLVLKKCCYWATLAGALSTNKETRRITISRQNLFTPEKLVALLEIIEQGDKLP